MARVEEHLSVDELQAAFRSSRDGVEVRHYQTIWHLARGLSVAETAELTGFGRRWVEQLLSRYNALGPRALGDWRRGNGTAPRVLTAEVLARLGERIRTAPDGGGVWSGRKAAAFIAAELGVERLSAQRGCEALHAIGYSVQRPRHARAATLDEQKGFERPRRDRRVGECQEFCVSGYWPGSMMAALSP